MKRKVFGIVESVMNAPPGSINEDSSSDDIEGWDSLRHMNLVLALEEEFGVEFGEEQILEMTSVRNIVAALDQVSNEAS